MPVYQVLEDHDETFRTLSYEPVIINTLRNQTEEDRTKFLDMIMTRYSSDCISLAPVCQCGATKGRSKMHQRCGVCNKFPTSVTEDEIDPIIWLERPEGVEKLMNLAMWSMLGDRLTRSGFNFFEWLVDTDYRPSVKTPVAITEKILASGIKRGYNNFVKNFDQYIKILFFDIKEFRKKRNEVDWHWELIQRDRSKIFCERLPLPNKAMTILEKTNLGRFLDPIMKDVISSFWDLVSIDRDFIPRHERHREKKTVKALIRYNNYQENYSKENYCQKQGLIRRNFAGSRQDYSYRFVIISITGSHDMREVHAPWRVGLTTFRPMILNKLIKRGWSNKDAVNLIMTHIDKYHPLLSELMDEMIAETPGSNGYMMSETFDRDINLSGAGFPQITQRNPSLLQASAVRTFLTQFKKDPSDKTVSISILICPGQNADFDGDEENNSLALDKPMALTMEALDPMYNLCAIDTPFKVCGNFSFPKPDAVTLSQFLEDGFVRH